MSFPCYTHNKYINKLSFLSRLRRIRKKGPQFLFCLLYGERKARKKFFRLCPKSLVALRSTSLAAAVAQNGYFDQNVAPAQQRTS